MTRRFTLDLLERVLWTFAQGALGEWIVTTSLDAQTLKVAAVAGLVSVAKCLLAQNIGQKDAATLPAPSTTAGEV